MVNCVTFDEICDLKPGTLFSYKDNNYIRIFMITDKFGDCHLAVNTSNGLSYCGEDFSND